MATLNINQTTRAFMERGQKHEDPLYVLEAYKGRIVPVETEDGPSDDFAGLIVLRCGLSHKPLFDFRGGFCGGLCPIGDEGDHTYISGMDKADLFIERIKRKGVIDLDHWMKAEEEV